MCVNHILGGGSFSSRLYSEVREKRGLAYGVSYEPDLAQALRRAARRHRDARRRAPRETLAIIESEIAPDGQAKARPRKSSTRPRHTSRAPIALRFDTSTKIAGQLVQIQLDKLGIDYIERRDRLIDAVTLADAKRVAKRLLDGGLLVTVVGRPQGVTSTSEPCWRG